MKGLLLMEELYTMVEMAKILKTPESTIRYRIKQFLEFMHYTGAGRDRRFYPGNLLHKDYHGKIITTLVTSDLMFEVYRFELAKAEKLEKPLIISWRC